MVRQFQFAITDMDDLSPTPDYRKCDHLGVVPSLPEGADFETQQVGPSRGTKADGKAIQYVFWGRLLYAEMNGTDHVSGFAIMLNPHASFALEYNSDSYNYYN